MEICPNCKSKLNIDEKSSGRCFSCGATFESSLPNYKNTCFKNNIKNNLCKFLIGIFSILSILCLFIFISSKEEYTIAKGEVATKKVNAIQSNIWDLNPSVDTSKLEKIELKRNICIGGIFINIVGVAACCIILFSKSNKTQSSITKTQLTNNSTKSKLQELEQIYKSNLITEEEYKSKRKEIINKL